MNEVVQKEHTEREYQINIGIIVFSVTNQASIYSKSYLLKDLCEWFFYPIHFDDVWENSGGKTKKFPMKAKIKQEIMKNSSQEGGRDFL